MDHNIQIVLADASEEFRRVLALTLVEEPGMQLVGDTGDGEEAVRLVGELQPDVLVMDVVLARMDGLEVLEEICQLSARMIVNPVSMQMERSRIREIVMKLQNER